MSLGRRDARMAALAAALLVVLAVSAGAQTGTGTGTVADPIWVASDWALKPSPVPVGGMLRLLAFTGSRRDATSTDIDTYNTFVQQEVAADGHAAIQDHAALFRVLGSTAAVDARDNTATNPADGRGVPIYWLRRAGSASRRVAADYARLYSGSWETRVQMKTNGGTLSNLERATAAIATGTAGDGTAVSGHELGADTVRTLYDIRTGSRPSDNHWVGGEELGDSEWGNEGDFRFYALSPVFRVGVAGAPYVTEAEVTSMPAAAKRDYVAGDTIQVTVSFSEAVTVTGTPRLPLKFQVEHPAVLPNLVTRHADYSADGSTTTGLVFEYQVVAADRDSDGLELGGAVELNSGTIVSTASSATAANLTVNLPGVLTGHRVNGVPYVVGMDLISRPLQASTYRRGEIIEIEVAFSEPVAVDWTGGVPLMDLRFRKPGNTRDVDMDYRRVTGSGVVFGYQVAAGDVANDLKVRTNVLDANGGRIYGAETGRDAALEHEIKPEFGYRVDGTTTAGTASDDAALGRLDVASFSTTDGADPAPIALNPAFDPDTLDYATQVQNAVSAITVAASAREGSATVSFSAGDDDADADGRQLNLAVGNTPLTVTVTAGDRAMTKAYSLQVTRLAAGELATVTIAADEPRVTEGTPAAFTLSRTGAPTAALTVDVAVERTGAALVAVGPARRQVTFAADGDHGGADRGGHG